MSASATLPQQAPGPTAAPSPAGPPSDAEVADLSGLVAALGRWYWEVLDGRRDPRQLRRLLTPACERRVLSAAARRHRERLAGPDVPGGVVRVARATARWVGSTCEGVAVVDRGGRTTAVAVTLQRHRGRLRVTDLARPEGSMPPLRPPPPA